MLLAGGKAELGSVSGSGGQANVGACWRSGCEHGLELCPEADAIDLGRRRAFLGVWESQPIPASPPERGLSINHRSSCPGRINIHQCCNTHRSTTLGNVACARLPFRILCLFQRPAGPRPLHQATEQYRYIHSQVCVVQRG